MNKWTCSRSNFVVTGVSTVRCFFTATSWLEYLGVPRIRMPRFAVHLSAIAFVLVGVVFNAVLNTAAAQDLSPPSGFEVAVENASSGHVRISWDPLPAGHMFAAGTSSFQQFQYSFTGHFRGEEITDPLIYSGQSLFYFLPVRGTTHYLRMRFRERFDGGAAGEWSTVFVETFPGTAPDAPPKVGTVTLSPGSVTNTSLNIKFPDFEGLRVNYEIQYAENADFNRSVITRTIREIESTGYDLTGLAPGITHYVRVRAFIGTEFGSYSDTATASTGGSAQLRIPHFDPDQLICYIGQACNPVLPTAVGGSGNYSYNITGRTAAIPTPIQARRQMVER